MWIEIDQNDPVPQLMDPLTFTAFSVRSDAGPAVIDESLRCAGLGVVVANHAFIEPDALRRLAPRSARNWLSDLEAMIEFADQHGWTDEQGRLRAHIESPR